MDSSEFTLGYFCVKSSCVAGVYAKGIGGVATALYVTGEYEHHITCQSNGLGDLSECECDH